MQLFFCPLSRKFPAFAKSARNVTGWKIPPGDILSATFTRAAKGARVTVRRKQKWELLPESSQKNTKKYKNTHLWGGIFWALFPPLHSAKKWPKFDTKMSEFKAPFF